MAKYLNPYTDFSFKKLFGEEGNKELLVDFLNQLSPDYQQIVEQCERYEQSLFQYRDLKSALETAVEECGIEIALKAIKKDFDNETIADLTGLPIEQIEQLRKPIKKN